MTTPRRVVQAAATATLLSCRVSASAATRLRHRRVVRRHPFGIQRNLNPVRAPLLRALLAVALLSFSAAGLADISSEALKELVGYTVVGVLRITGWRDENGKKGDSFEGCEYGRVIIFQGDKALTCSGYRYHYGYRPEAIIFAQGGSFKMIVGDDVYDMRN